MLKSGPGRNSPAITVSPQTSLRMPITCELHWPSNDDGLSASFQGIGWFQEWSEPPTSGVHVPSGPQLRYSIFCHHEVDVSLAPISPAWAKVHFLIAVFTWTVTLKWKCARYAQAGLLAPWFCNNSFLTEWLCCNLSPCSFHEVKVELALVMLGGCTQREVELFFFFFWRPVGQCLVRSCLSVTAEWWRIH